MTSDPALAALEALETLPRFGIRNVSVYGSKYLENKENSQLDMLISVQSSLVDEWHKANLDINPKHYFLNQSPSFSLKLAQKVCYNSLRNS